LEATDRIVTVIPTEGERVGTAASKQDIVTRSSNQSVGTITTKESIRSSAALQRIDTVGASQVVIKVGTADIFNGTVSIAIGIPSVDRCIIEVGKNASRCICITRSVDAAATE